VDLATLTPGETLVLEMDAEEHFKNALYATGGGDMLAIDGTLTEYATTGTAPRTVLGVKADGSFKIWAIDGRQSVTSMGMSLLDCANLLLSEGYTNVINLDGGGSTALSVQLPGDTDPYIVNSPSDGTPRKCATYILFVNKTEATMPSKAQVYPIDPVVMANSTTTVYALGYDKNYNGFGEITADISASAGLIEGNKYIAPNEAGKYTLSASASGLSVTTTTYTVVESPDRMFIIKDGKNITDSVSLLPNVSVDFNVLAFAQSRKLYNDDTAYSWSVSGNCGTVDSNGIFKASSLSGAKGSLTVTAGNISKTISITVGAEPYKIEGFENNFESLVTALPEDSASASLTTSYEQARFGKKAFVAQYNSTENARFELPLNLKSSISSLSLWYKTEGDGALLSFNLNDGSVVSTVLDSANWTQINVAVPDGYASLSIDATGTGKIYLDNIYGYYDSGMTDTDAPVIQLMDISNGMYTVSVYDNSPFPLQSVRVQMDGKTISHNYDSVSGTVTFDNADLTKPHRFSVYVTDFFGNLSKASFDYAPESYEISFKDMGTSWARGCVYVLTENGIFSLAENFNPSSKATNAMVATMISRYMGINTDDYASVDLPFLDTDKIADWALPHVKALYALGIMKGSITAQGHVFLPNNNISRAQVMTILGRTIERGYSYNNTAIGFDDDNTIPSWAFDHIALLRNLGIVNGYGGQNVVKPLNDIQRSEIASLLYKLY
ncbi:MAG: phosphodiester glycosidase family protein, partial [Clostridia bacterium]|nr:phosphodiester glycosidase family protein [Clostridia bacterium]